MGSLTALRMKFTNHKYLLSGFLLSLLLFFAMELSWPYTFLKDDNLNQFLPVILEGMKQLFSGVLPVLNQFQATGLPLLEYGTYNVLYPPMMLSYLFATYLFHNPYYTFEIFVFLHILCAYLFTFLFLAYRGVNKLVAMLGSLAFVFSGYVLIATSNWYYVIPTAVFLPLILYLNHRAMDSKGLKFYLLLGFTRGLYFYAGNTQFFLYSLLFEVLYVFLYRCYDHRRLFSDLDKYLLSLFITLGFIFPLAFAQISILRESSRVDPSLFSYLFSYSSKPLEVLFGQLLPYPFVQSQSGFAGSPLSFTEIYYGGTLFFIFALIGLYTSLRARKGNIIKTIDPLLFLGALSFILSIGWRSVFYAFGFFIPFFKSFIAPFRFTVFTLFFITCFGVLTFSKLLPLFISRLKKYHLGSILVFLFLLVLLYHVTISARTAWSYPTDQIPLQLALPSSLSEGRMISLTYPDPGRSPLSNLDYLMYNYPTYFGIYHIAGYESFYATMVEKNTFINRPLRGASLNLDNLAAYGVRWILLPRNSLSFYPTLQNLPVTYSNDNFSILELTSAQPFVFVEDGSSINYTVLPNGFVFTTDFSTPTPVVVNTFSRNNYVAKVNGVEVQKYTDAFDRIVLEVPPGRNVVSVIYKPTSFFSGLYIGLSLLLVLFLYITFLRPQLEGKITTLLTALSHIHLKTPVLVFGLVLLFLIFALFSFFSFTSPASFERELRSITGLAFTVEGVMMISPSTYKLTDVTITDAAHTNILFTAEAATFTFDFKESLLSLLGGTEKGIHLRQIHFTNFHFNHTSFDNLFYPGSSTFCTSEGFNISTTPLIASDKTITSYTGDTLALSDIFVSPSMLFTVRSLVIDLDDSFTTDEIVASLQKIRRRYYFSGSSNTTDYFGQCFVLDTANKLYSRNLYLV